MSALIEIIQPASDFIQKRHASFIDGQSCASNSGSSYTLHNPATGQPLATTLQADAAQVDAIVLSAHQAFTSGRWTKLPPAERERVLLRFADLVEAHSEELAQIETLNQGKSINISRAIEVGASVNYMRYICLLYTSPSPRDS